MNTDQKDRLLAETQETAGRLNKLNTFMASPEFPKLPREDKDLLYSQQRVMSRYVQILGKRLERTCMKFLHALSTERIAVKDSRQDFQNPIMTPGEYKEAREKMKMSQGDIALIMGFSRKHINAREKGRTKISYEAATAIRTLVSHPSLATSILNQKLNA